MFVVSRWSSILSFLSGVMSASGGYFVLLLVALSVFLSTRVPYVYGLGGFAVFLFGWIFPLFLAFFLSRVVGGFSLLLSSFIPVGTPLWISPLVALAETVSYLVRPFVLLLRPFLNISIGAFGGLALGAMSISSVAALSFLFILFFYEVFVAGVHWFIVCNILSFSKDH